MAVTCDLQVKVILSGLPRTHHFLDPLRMLRGQVPGKEGIGAETDQIIGRDAILRCAHPGEVKDAARSILHEEDIV